MKEGGRDDLMGSLMGGGVCVWVSVGEHCLFLCHPAPPSLPFHHHHHKPVTCGTLPNPRSVFLVRILPFGFMGWLRFEVFASTNSWRNPQDEQIVCVLSGTRRIGWLVHLIRECVVCVCVCMRVCVQCGPLARHAGRRA